MLISAVAALVLFAAPEATQSGETAAAPAATAAAAEAKPATRKVCYETEVSGSRLPKKVCRTEKVKEAPKATEEAAAKTGAAKSE
jgi:hypothetical protein